MKHARDAFTLLELLLAIAIFGICAAVVGSVFFTAVGSWRTSTAAADAMHHADAVLEQVTAGIRSAYYPESKEPLDKYGFVQENDGDEMPACMDKISWVKIGDSLVGEDATYAGVPHRTELFLMDESDGPQGAGLYVRAWRLDGQEDDFDPEEDVEPVLISSAITGLDCKMVDREKEAEPGEEEPFEWLDEWETTNRVPESVLLSLAIAPPDDRRAEPLVLTRRIEIPLAGLSWDPIDTQNSSGSSRRTSAEEGTDDRSRSPNRSSGAKQGDRGAPARQGDRGAPARTGPATGGGNGRAAPAGGKP